MAQNLSDVFAEQSVADFLKQVRHPHIIEGANAFYNTQAKIYAQTRDQSAVFEWRLEGRSDVLIVNGDVGRKLAQAANVPFETTFFQYPTDKFKKVRSGQAVLGIEKAASSVPTAFIQKDLALSLIDPVMAREAQMQKVIDKLNDMIEKKGWTPEEVLQHLEKLEDGLYSPSSPSEPVA